MSCSGSVSGVLICPGDTAVTTLGSDAGGVMACCLGNIESG